MDLAALKSLPEASAGNYEQLRRLEHPGGDNDLFLNMKRVSSVLKGGN